jgi:L-arabinose isomerase
VEWAEQAPAEDIERQIAFDRQEFEIDPELGAEDHEEASRMEWALRRMVDKYSLHGFSFHFSALGEDRRFKTMPIRVNAVPRYTLRPGEATLINLTTTFAGRVKLTAAEGEVPDFKPVKGVLSPHGKFKPDRPLREFLDRYALAGGSHHGALAYGRLAESVGMVADLLGIEFERI